MSNEELKPCAHCGGEIDWTTLMGQMRFYCDDCKAETKFTEVGLHMSKQRERFNNRLSPWISVEDRLPDLKQFVIASGRWWGEVTGYDNEITAACGTYQGHREISLDSDKYETQLRDITHWMPIPTIEVSK